MLPSACCILDQTKYPWTISPEDSHCVFVPTKYNSYWMQVNNNIFLKNLHKILIPGLSSQAITVLNSAHLSSNPCTYMPPNSGDDSSDPSSVSVRPTKSKNRQDYTQGYGQGTPRLQTR